MADPVIVICGAGPCVVKVTALSVGAAVTIGGAVAGVGLSESI
jgi:hypothetical protein